MNAWRKWVAAVLLVIFGFLVVREFLVYSLYAGNLYQAQALKYFVSRIIIYFIALFPLFIATFYGASRGRQVSVGLFVFSAVGGYWYVHANASSFGLGAFVFLPPPLYFGVLSFALGIFHGIKKVSFQLPRNQ